jgi:hypothetical protein
VAVVPPATAGLLLRLAVKVILGHTRRLQAAPLSLLLSHGAPAQPTPILASEFKSIAARPLSDPYSTYM